MTNSRGYFSLFQTLKSKVLNWLQMRLYKVMVKPVLLYGCESWPLTADLEARLQVCENRMLRGIRTFSTASGLRWADIVKRVVA